ncbi:hypothetical protein GGE12_006469 [Rhizobium mongolense]|uniref:Resolvase/invertase-type recombinase catalytic domain-containing protein n=1 Tax=Rhizobium mongolense TaxID=57676 RepID=A0A7W6RVF7_9HYPH|nr:hypothetical protein [Rhizobium mongolense]
MAAFADRAGYEVVATFKETGSGAKLDRTERRKIMALAQSQQIDAILVAELSRWGRSTIDLLNTLCELEGWKVSIIAMSGMTRSTCRHRMAGCWRPFSPASRGSNATSSASASNPVSPLQRRGAKGSAVK